jgi:hypothetical protein
MGFKRSIGLLLLTGLGCQASSSSSGGKSVLPGVDAVVFAKRAYVTKEGTHDVAGGAGQVIDYLRYDPGGGVFVLDPPAPDGKLTNLTSGFKDVDISGLDLSFDAKEVVFSMRHGKDDGHYHIYKAKLDGTRVKQLTFGPYDDIRPIYVPGKRVAFATNEGYTELGTRADEYNHNRASTQMATISSESGDADRHVCAQSLSHVADPFLMSDGTVGYSRWEHLGPINDVKLFHMNPDCTGMTAVAGQHGKDFNSIVQVREVSEGKFVGIGTSREGTIQAGAIMSIDTHAKHGSAKLDEQGATFKSLTPDVPMGMEPSPVGRYRTPFDLGDGRLLVSWANGDVSERLELTETAPKFGIFLLDPKTQKRTIVYDDEKTWDLYAQPVRPREEPAVRSSRIDVPADPTAANFGMSEAAVIGSIDVANTSLDETVEGGQFAEPVALGEALKQATHVRIIEGFSSEIGSVRMFGLTMHEGAAILGEVPVQPDRSWEAHVVPYLPYHLQPIDRFGLAIRNELLWIQAMPGENRTCGGCHESRATNATATQGATLAQQLPVAKKDFSQIAIADRMELPWYGAKTGAMVQDVFDAKCVQCHDGGAQDPFAGREYTVTVPPAMDDPMAQPLMFKVPYLKLTSDAIDSYYEKETVAYPASYVTLLYPSAMMGEVKLTGDVPDPPWVEPGSARGSRLIQKVNASSESDVTEWAWKTPAHPEDVGVTLTPEERLTLIRMADLGAQYYSRRNAEGK